MSFKIGRSIIKKPANSFVIADYFTPNIAEVLANALYWLALSKVAVMVAFNRAGTSCCITLYQDKGKESLWSNSPEELLDLLARLSNEAGEAAKAEGLA